MRLYMSFTSHLAALAAMLAATMPGIIPGYSLRRPPRRPRKL